MPKGSNKTRARRDVSSGQAGGKNRLLSFEAGEVGLASFYANVSISTRHVQGLPCRCYDIIIAQYTSKITVSALGWYPACYFLHPRY